MKTSKLGIGIGSENKDLDENEREVGAQDHVFESGECEYYQ